MSTLDLNFPFKKSVTLVPNRSSLTSCASLPKESITSSMNFSNTSRFQEKKVLRKLHEQEVINRIEMTLKRFQESDRLVKEALKYHPVVVKKHKREKQN